MAAHAWHSGEYKAKTGLSVMCTQEASTRHFAKRANDDSLLMYFLVAAARIDLSLWHSISEPGFQRSSMKWANEACGTCNNNIIAMPMSSIV